MRRSRVSILVTVFLVGAVAAPGPGAAAPVTATPPVATTPEPSIASDFDILAIAAGAEFTCAIRGDHSLLCWGSTTDTEVLAPPAGAFQAVDAGSAHACAIRMDGTLACWGRSADVAAAPPPGTFTSVTAGSGFSCAIASDRTLTCWGSAPSGAASPPGAFLAVDAGEGFACAVRDDGTLACWGDDELGQASPPAGTYVAVAAGGMHACAIATGGTVTCWGFDSLGQASPPPDSFVAVSAGWVHTCGIRMDGTVACWGSDEAGVSTPPPGQFTAVSAGATHACGITAAATQDCWGVPLPPPLPVARIATLPTFLATQEVKLHWAASAALAPIDSYDMRSRRAKWSAGFEPWVGHIYNTMVTDVTHHALPGYTYCFSVRAIDADGFRSDWTTPTCTAIPLDDRSFARSWSWVDGTGAAYYRSTYVRSTNRTATLTRPGVVATRIALLATTCPTCGSVAVYWGSTLLKRLNLYSATTVNRKLLPVASFSSTRSGTLRIVVTSSGRRVIVDGVAIYRKLWTPSPG